ncbi:spore morphogenesis/germination protein YwcE [Bacillaceae bacterium S4-13-56]
MDVLLMYLLIFSMTPFILWSSNRQKMAITQLIFVVIAWVILSLHIINVPFGSYHSLLWGIFAFQLILGHAAFMMVYADMYKEINEKKRRIEDY